MNKYINIINNSCVNKLTTKFFDGKIPEMLEVTDSPINEPHNRSEPFNSIYDVNIPYFNYFLGEYMNEYMYCEPEILYKHLYENIQKQHMASNNIIIIKHTKEDLTNFQITLAYNIFTSSTLQEHTFNYKTQYNNDFFDKIEYGITHIPNGKNSISLILCVKKNKMYLLLFTNGNEIKCHKKHSDKFYVPYKIAEICDDMTKKQDAYKKYKMILLFDIYLKYLNKLDGKSKIDKDFIKLHHSFYSILSEESKNKFDTHFKITDGNLDPKNGTSLNHFIKNYKKDVSSEYELIIPRKTYYELLCDYFFKDPSNELEYDVSACKFDMKEVNAKINNDPYNNMPKHIKNKINLHCHNNELYIYSQDTDTYSWFHMYWPLLFYHIINYNPDKYYELIWNIFNDSYTVINSIFTRSNFVTEYASGNSYYNYMVNIFNKLINLDILPRSRMASIYDIIYDISFNIRQPSDVSNTSPNIFSINKEIITTIEFYNTSYNKNEIITYIISILFNTHSKTNTNIVYMLWELCIKEIYIFKDNKKLDADDIVKQLKDRSKNTKKSEFGYIYDESYDKIKILIKMYNDIVEIEKTQKDPIFIIDYYHLVSYLYGLYKYNELLLYNYKDDSKSDELIRKFSIYLHKFIILSKILEYSIKKIDDNTIKCDIITYILKQSLEFSDDQKLEQMIITKSSFNLFNTPNESIDLLSTYQDDMRVFWDDLKCEFSLDTIDLNTFKTYNKFLLNNPHIIYESITQRRPNGIYDETIYDETIYDTSYASNFIKMNIFEIFKDENIHNNMLNYFLRKYYNYNKNKENTHMLIIYKNLQLLLQKFINSSEYQGRESKYNNKNQCSYNYPLFEPLFLEVYKPSPAPLETFIVKLKRYLESYPKVDDFCSKVIENKKSFASDTLLNILVKKYNFTQTNDKVIINSVKYTETKLDPINPLIRTFCQNTDYVVLYSASQNIIYILTIDYKLEIQCTQNNSYYQINTIKYNDNQVIKMKDIYCPFKYIIPNNFIYLIYSSNNIYYVTYFINESLEPKKNNLLNGISIQSPIVKISINKNNLMYPNKMSLNELENFQSLLLNGGINKYNLIYVHPQKWYGAHITNKEYDYMKNKGDDMQNKSNIYASILPPSNITQIDFLIKDTSNVIVSLEMKKDDVDKMEIPQNANESLQNLLFKISKCNINPNKSERHAINNNLINIINKSNDLIKQMTLNMINKKIINFHDLINKSVNIYDYLLYLKMSNICKDLLVTPNNELCSKIKLYYEQLKIKKSKFKYNFEQIFELLFGNELTDEQYTRYHQIIESYQNTQKHTLSKYTKSNKTYSLHNEYIYKYEQQGGKQIYPIHHFMMGKGKSSVISPLLSLYFTLIEQKIVYIIVPQHLKLQTIDTMLTYITVFNLNNIINIVSDSEIKNMFLNGNFNNEDRNKNTIFIIDEIDSILDPLKSNYNIVFPEKKSSDTNTVKDVENVEVVKVVKNIITLLSHPPKSSDESKPKNMKKILSTLDKKSLKNIDLLKKDIMSIYISILKGELKENINWGIHPIKCYAIPFMNKDKPLLQSSFSSYVLTLFLTYYYYLILYPKKLTPELYNYTIKHNLLEKLFHKTFDSSTTINVITKFLENQAASENFFNTIIDSIITDIKLTDEQYNTSFVDIINIDYIYKIGYSGTVNIERPELENTFMDVVNDQDETLNVKYAILKSNIIDVKYENDLTKYFNNIKIDKYDALIDTCGLFKNYENEYIAKKLYDRLSRPIIFLNSKDQKLIINKNETIKYDENDSVTKPFLYYSQTHIIGIDINQDKYPNIHGLCIIDNTSSYTIVAQSIFRLRKLNMGHRIDFNIHRIDANNTLDLYDVLKKKDETSKKNKIQSLKFQTLKSLIRKKKSGKLKETIDNSLFMDNYKEKIKYYFNFNEDKANILVGIIDINNMTPTEKQIYDDIQNDISRLVYNISSTDIDIQQEQEQEQDQEHEQDIKKSDVPKKPELNHVLFETPSTILLKKDTYTNIFADDIKDKIFMELNSYTTKIKFLINIFTLKNTYYCHKYIQTLYGNHDTFKWKCDYMFILHNQHLYLINGSILQYVHDKYCVLDLNLLLVNNKTPDNIDNLQIVIDQLYKNSQFLKILNCKNTDNELLAELSDDEKFVLLQIFNTYDYHSMTETQRHYYVELDKDKSMKDIYNTFKTKLESKYANVNEMYKLKKVT